MAWLLWPWHKYQHLAIQRELHIANAANPLVWLDLVCAALKTAALPIAVTLLLLIFGFALRQHDHVAAIAGDLIACIALWFGLTRSRDAIIIDAITSVCQRSTNIGPHTNGYQHIRDMIPKFRNNLRFYNRSVIVVNVNLFLSGIALSFP